VKARLGKGLRDLLGYDRTAVGRTLSPPIQ
jgi:hypothetical protein